MEEKLVTWKAALMSFPARICMLTSVLAAIPSLYFRCMILPTGILKKMDAIARNFLWGGKHKIRWIDWDTACRPRDIGGLGIKSAEDMNNGLFAKQVAKIMDETEETTSKNTWQHLVQKKYGGNNGGGPIRSTSYAWKCTKKALEGRMINKRWKVGTGRNIRIWWDRWILEEPLVRYPWIMDGRLIDDRKVSDLIDNNGDWNLSEIVRILPEGVRNQLRQLIRETTDLCLSSNLVDGKFSVAMAYKNIWRFRGTGKAITDWKPGKYLTSRRIWWFIWKLIRDRLPTKDNLYHRNIIDNGTCAMCGDHLETVQHLFLECPFAVSFWIHFQNAFDWKLKAYDMETILRRVTDIRKLDIWMATSQGLTGLGLWILWKARNDVVFKTRDNLVQNKTHIRKMVLQAVVSFKESWTLRTFSLLQHDLRFDAWKQGVGRCGWDPPVDKFL